MSMRVYDLEKENDELFDRIEAIEKKLGMEPPEEEEESNLLF